MEEVLKKEWIKVEELIVERFGEKLDEQTILFLIGLQELGKGMGAYKKEEKVDIMHIGVCTVLSKYGYYQKIGDDNDGWPHFKNIKKLPNEIQGEDQQNFLKKAIIDSGTAKKKKIRILLRISERFWKKKPPQNS